jgi:hypothetical protein
MQHAQLTQNVNDNQDCLIQKAGKFLRDWWPQIVTSGECAITIELDKGANSMTINAPAERITGKIYPI